MNRPLPLFTAAACVDKHELFEPEFGLELDAKRVCAFCPDRDPCLLWALRVREPFGIYGGMTAVERGRLLEQMPKVAA